MPFTSKRTPGTFTREAVQKMYMDNPNVDDEVAADLQLLIERSLRSAEEIASQETHRERGQDNGFLARSTPKSLNEPLARFVLSAYTPRTSKNEHRAAAAKRFRDKVKDIQAVAALSAQGHYILAMPPPAPSPSRALTMPPPVPSPSRAWSSRKGRGSKRKVKSKKRGKSKRKAKVKKVRFSRTRRPRRSKRQSRRIRRRKPTPYRRTSRSRSKTNSVYSGTFSPTDVPTL